MRQAWASGQFEPLTPGPSEGGIDLRRILVPLDGSDLAERALPLAEQLAGRSGAQLILVRAPLARVFAGLDAFEEGDAESAAVVEARAYLQRVVERLQGRGLRLDVATPRSPHEDQGLLVGQVARPSFPFRQLADTLREAAEAIVREAGAREADLIVMATHGRSGLERWVHGSVALEVLRRLSTPLVLVRADVPNLVPEAGPVRILVPLDGTPLSETALDAAAMLARLFGGSLVLLRAIPALRRSVAAWLAGPLIGDPTEHAALQAAAESYLEGARASLAARGIPSEVLMVEGDAAPAIPDAAGKHACALIAMATHARVGLAQLASEHVAESVVLAAPTPVLLVHPTETVEERRVPTERMMPTERLIPAAGAPTEASAAGLVGLGDEPAAVQASPLTVSLSREDRELIRIALQALMQSSRRDEHLVGPIQRVLAALDDAGQAS